MVTQRAGDAAFGAIADPTPRAILDLLRERRVAQSRLYSLAPAALAGVDQWLAPYRLYRAARLSDLKRAVEEDLRG